MNINIPPDSEGWLFADRGPRDTCLWSFGWPPPCEVGDDLVFRFGGRPVATAVVYAILPPGDPDTWSHHGRRRRLRGHKVVWLQSSFVDLRRAGGVLFEE